MEVTRLRALRGPNLWTRQTALEAVVRCELDEMARPVFAMPARPSFR